MRALLAVMAMLATAAFAVPTTYAEQCGSQARGTLCSNSLCCNNCNWCALAELHLRHCLCASTSDNCGGGCHSQCNGCCGSESRDGGSVASFVSESLFDRMLLHRDDAACPAKGFYTYTAFVAAASTFPGFGTTGDADTRRREVAAFLAQTSHETVGGGRWAAAPPDGPYSWGYCLKEENDSSQASSYCDPSNAKYACAAGKKYYGRGPIQISYNYNYGPAGQAIGEDLLGDPDLVATDPTVSFKTAIWYWMTPRSPMPSCHDVVTGRWRPSGEDRAAGREPGYGAVTNILNGDIECGHGVDDSAADRIGFYQRYCDILGVSYGDNLYCYDQRPF